MKWEYHVVTIGIPTDHKHANDPGILNPGVLFPDTRTLTATLERFGADEWELVSATPMPPRHDRYLELTLVLKRPLKNPLVDTLGMLYGMFPPEDHSQLWAVINASLGIPKPTEQDYQDYWAQQHNPPAAPTGETESEA